MRKKTGCRMCVSAVRHPHRLHGAEVLAVGTSPPHRVLRGATPFSSLAGGPKAAEMKLVSSFALLRVAYATAQIARRSPIPPSILVGRPTRGAVAAKKTA